MEEVIELKAAMAALLDHLAGEGHGGLYQHANCQLCLDVKRAYQLLGVEYEYIEQPTVVAVLPMAAA